MVYIAGLMILHLVVYGADMFHFSLCGDELVETMEKVPDIYIAQRRWGVALWKEVFGYGYLPYLNVFIFAFISSLTIWLQTRLFRFEGTMSQMVYGVAYTACPVWGSLVRISHLTDIFALSMLCSTLVVYVLLRKKTISGIAASILMMMGAMSLYQTSVFYVATLWVAWYATQTLRGERPKFWAEGIKVGAIVVAGWGSCFVVSCVLRRMGLASLDVLHMVANYQNQFSENLRHVISGSLHEGLANILKNTVLYALGINAIVGGNKVFTHIYYMSGAFCCFCACFSFARYNGKQVWTVIATLFLLLAIPYATYLISGGTMVESRMYMCSGLSVAAMWGFCADLLRENKKAKCVLFAILGMIALKSIYCEAIMARDSAWYMEQTRLQFFKIRDEAARVAEAQGLPSQCRVIWVGDEWPMQKLPVSDALKIAESPFLGGLVQPFAVKNYAAYFGCGHMEWAWSIPAEMEETVRSMPEWPQPGSVKRFGDDIIVKVYKR